MVLVVLILDHLLTLGGTSPLWLSLIALPLAARWDWRRAASSKVRAGHTLLYLYLAVGLIPWPNPGDPQVIILKHRRELVYRDKTMRIALGNHPEGDKEDEGDGRTPEGCYRLCSKASDSHYGFWLGLDYPNRRDAWRGRLSGRLSWLELTRWNWFWRNEPPQTTRLGGQIGIHGGGSRRDWTLGCVGLDEKDIKVLFGEIPLGTVVEIRQ